MADPIVLPARLDLFSVPAVLSEITARRDEKVIDFDASEVGHFGALGLQAVMVAVKHMAANDGQVTLRNVSERALAQLSDFGVTPETLVEGAI